MSRDEITRADMDVGFYADRKIGALARLLREPVTTAAYAALYDATVRASWKAGRRLTLEESLPAWWLAPFDDAMSALIAVALLDAEGRVLEHAWASWYLPAAERIADARVAGMVGGLMRSLRLSKDDAVAEARRRLAKADLADPRVTPSPTEPTEPTDPPTDEGATKPGDPVASKLAPPRPGSLGQRRRERDELLKDDGEARDEIERRLARSGQKRRSGGQRASVTTWGKAEK